MKRVTKLRTRPASNYQQGASEWVKASGAVASKWLSRRATSPYLSEFRTFSITVSYKEKKSRKYSNFIKEKGWVPFELPHRALTFFQSVFFARDLHFSLPCAFCEILSLHFITLLSFPRFIAKAVRFSVIRWNGKQEKEGIRRLENWDTLFFL